MSFARNLRPRHRTAILPDAPASTRAGTIAKFALAACFDAVVRSGEIKASKPDPRAFGAVLDALDVAAKVAVFIDDVPSNVDAATSLGMKTILCTTAKQTITDLSALLGE